MKRIAVICTHPIQYYAPAFRELACRAEIDLKVFYGWRGAENGTFDPGFAQEVRWDIPLLEGYDYEFIPNVSKTPGSHRFRGIQLPTLIPSIERWCADAVLIYGWCYQSHLASMRYFKGKIPVLFRGDSTLLDERWGPRAALRRLVLRWVYSHVDIAFSVGTNNHMYLRQNGLHENQIVHAPHAIDNQRFSNGEHTSRLRQELGIAKTALVLLFCGKLESKKAPDILLQAFNRLERNDTHLIFAGSGPMENELRSQANSRTHFIGFQNQSQMPGVYASANLFILPSRGPGETWGLALNEAMASGLGVIASNHVGGAIDLIKPGKNGWMVEANCVSSLQHYLQQVMSSDRELLVSFGHQSKAIIQKWSISKQVDAMCEVFHREVPRHA